MQKKNESFLRVLVFPNTCEFVVLFRFFCRCVRLLRLMLRSSALQEQSELWRLGSVSLANPRVSWLHDHYDIYCTSTTQESGHYSLTKKRNQYVRTGPRNPRGGLQINAELMIAFVL